MHATSFKSLLGLFFFFLTSSTAAKTTTIGLETADASRGISVPLGDCGEIDEYEVYKVAVTKRCRVFAGPYCTGRNALLQPGEHEVGEPVPLGSAFCEEEEEL
ncbi:hypothetical protein BJX61DRAFT_78849 [Aspergillus egyptiacus]|nr:hypothetical protein BJX61DRAFT_78849 [Aspergillus egyptiacus]